MAAKDDYSTDWSTWTEESADQRYVSGISQLQAMALERHEAGDPAAAGDCYRQILATDPENLDALYNLGVIQHAAGELDAAMACYRQVLALDESHPQAHFTLGNALKEQQRFAEAAASYEAALAVEPEHTGAVHNLGILHHTTGDLAAAADCYLRALEIDPHYSEAHYNLGIIHYGLGHLEEAAGCYARAIQANPREVDAFYNLGIVFKELGNLDEAIGCYESALEIKPDDADVLYNLGIALREADRLDEAAASYRRALAIDPEYASAYSNLGIIMHIQGRVDEAIDCYRQALARNHNAEASRHILAALTGTTTATAPREYVQNLFDGYSQRFDRSLLEELRYNVPFLLHRLAVSHLGEAAAFEHAVDLGCGTGLSGVPFRAATRRLTGVDLSPKMVEKAGEKGIYDQLAVDDVVDFLARSAACYDLFIACDVLVYIGELGPFFKAVRQRAATGACCLFSTESHAGEGFVLRQSGRYAHNRRYVEETAAAHGFKVLVASEEGIRWERDGWIRGELFVVQRQG